jgi:hypothetical protein
VVAGRDDKTLSLARTDGALVATVDVSPTSFRPNAVMSWTSTSLKRLYYLDAGYQVRFLGLDGAKGVATQISVHANEETGFAVSPDDKRIAVSIFGYTPRVGSSHALTYNGMRLYVEDLDGGGHHVDIFDSTTMAAFPIGWTGGNLVIAVSTPQCCETPQLNPYGATAYHVVDLSTGRWRAALCGDRHEPSGPIETFGVMCTERGAQFWRWDGIEVMGFAAMPYPSLHLSAVSPDGTDVAVGREQGTISLLGKRGNIGLGISGYVYGWLDSDHIIFGKERQTFDTSDNIIFGSDWQISLSIYDLQAQRIAAVPASMYLGTLPTRIS